MRVLGIGDTVDLGDMYLRLMARGHEVRVYAADPDARGIMEGMLTFVPDYLCALEWARSGRVVFESEFVLQNDVNALTCPNNALCLFGHNGGARATGSSAGARRAIGWSKIGPTDRR